MGLENQSLLARLLRVAKDHPDRTAFRSHGQTITYRDFYAQVGGIREQLLEARHGGLRLDIVGINCDRASVTTYASIVAVWSVGAAYVPLKDTLPSRRLEPMLAQAEVEVILTDKAWNNPAGADLTTIVAAASGPEISQWPEPSSEGPLAYLMFTSGSTGTPKGVPITHANLEAFALMMLTNERFGFDQEDRFLQMFELSFDLSVVSYLIPLLIGATVCLVEEGRVFYMDVLKTLRDEQVTVALMVPSVLAYAAPFVDRIRLPAMRASHFCGEALLVDHLRLWRRVVPNAQITNLYGPTEATIYCLAASCGDDTVRSHHGMVEIGNPIGSTTVAIVDEDGRPVRAGQQGELVLRGPQVMTGYWKNVEKTAAAFTADGAYRTGDITYQGEDGHIYYCGRLDSQVKIDGHRIELGEIEQAARDVLGSDRQVAATTFQTDGSVRRIGLFVAGSSDTKTVFEADLRSRLPDYMWPAVIVFVAQMPLNGSGKTDRNALRATYLDGK